MHNYEVLYFTVFEFYSCLPCYSLQQNLCIRDLGKENKNEKNKNCTSPLQFRFLRVSSTEYIIPASTNTTFTHTFSLHTTIKIHGNIVSCNICYEKNYVSESVHYNCCFHRRDIRCSKWCIFKSQNAVASVMLCLFSSPWQSS